MSIHSKAMLVTLNIKGWRANKKDDNATREVHEKHNATDAGVFRKHLIDPKALKTVQQAATAARAYHYENTLPWGEQGARILTTDGKLDYDRRMRSLKDEYSIQVEQFIGRYPEEIEKAKVKLNGLFNASEYPSVEDLRERFGFKTTVLPIPHVDDFRIQLAQEDMNDIKAELREQIATLSNNAQRSLWLRLNEALLLISETLKNPKRRWFQSTFKKLDEMADIIMKLNYTGNKELNDLALKAKASFADLDLKSCKQQNTIREAAANEADAMLSKISEFI